MLDDPETTIWRSGSGKVCQKHAVGLKRRKDKRQKEGDNVNSHMLGKNTPAIYFYFIRPSPFPPGVSPCQTPQNVMLLLPLAGSEGLVCEEK